MHPRLSKMVSQLKDKIDILIVDDDVDMAETLSDILTALGIQVEIAHDGCAAIEKTKAKMFDIVLMDIKMPKMNGVESYKKIKQIRPQTTVVLMTAYAAQAVPIQEFRKGLDNLRMNAANIIKRLFDPLGIRHEIQ